MTVAESLQREFLYTKFFKEKENKEKEPNLNFNV